MRNALHRRQPAQIAIVAPFAVVALMSVLGLVIDFGVFRLIDSELQNAAEAAALAAVWYAPICPTTDSRCASDNAPGKADSVAQQFGRQNLGLATVLCGSVPVVNPPLQQSLNQPHVPAATVIVHCQAGYIAGRILGLGSIDITRWASAAIGNAEPAGASWKMGDNVVTPGTSLIAGLVSL